ncbi:MAG: Clp protease N-terminal domain-containing protein [Elusimicrobiota bacterium]
MPNDEGIFDGPIYYPPIHFIITNSGIVSEVQALSKEEALAIAGYNTDENVFCRPAKKNEEACDFVTNIILDITKKHKQLALLSVSAEKVLDIAEQEADKSIGVANGTVHSGFVLLGLISEEHGIAGKFLREKNIKKEEISEMLKKFSEDNIVSCENQLLKLTTKFGTYIDTRFLLLALLDKNSVLYKILENLGFKSQQFLSDFLIFLKNNNSGIGDIFSSNNEGLTSMNFAGVSAAGANCPASAYQIYKNLKTPVEVLEKIALEEHLKECRFCLLTAAFIKSSSDAEQIQTEDVLALW